MPFVTIVAKRAILAPLAQAKNICFVGSNEIDRLEYGTLVRIVTERLTFG